jgi:hypothetical protein
VGEKTSLSISVSPSCSDPSTLSEQVTLFIPILYISKVETVTVSESKTIQVPIVYLPSISDHSTVSDLPSRNIYSSISTAVNNGDSQLSYSQPNTNFGSQTYFQAGIFGYFDYATYRGVISLTTPSPYGEIISTKLHLYRWLAGDNTDGYTLDLYFLNKGFVESQVTWNAYSTGNNWTTPGGDITGGIISSIPLTPDTGPVSFDNVPVILWNTQYDFIMKGSVESGNHQDGYYLYSKESSTPSYRPYLEILYIPGVYATTSDQATVSEKVTVFISTLCPSVHDTSTVTGSVTLRPQSFLSTSSGVSVSESFSSVVFHPLPVSSDHTSVSENLSLLTAFSLKPSDNVTTSGTANVVIGKVFSKVDAATTSESLHVSVIDRKFMGDLATVSETVVVNIPTFLTASDHSVLTGTVTVNQVYLIPATFLNDTTTTSENIQTLYLHARNRSIQVAPRAFMIQR